MDGLQYKLNLKAQSDVSITFVMGTPTSAAISMTPICSTSLQFCPEIKLALYCEVGIYLWNHYVIHSVISRADTLTKWFKQPSNFSPVNYSQNFWPVNVRCIKDDYQYGTEKTIFKVYVGPSDKRWEAAGSHWLETP